MPARKAVVRSPIGLHARPAAAFVRAVTLTGFAVRISKAGRPAVDARSLLEVMTEDFDCGCEVELSIQADLVPAGSGLSDADQALDGLCALLDSQAG